MSTRLSAFLKWVTGALALLVAGVALLQLLGNFFVREITEAVDMGAPEAAPAAALGRPAPFFRLPDLDGKPVEISDFRGRPLVVAFWAAWNPAAADQLKILDAYAAKGETPFAILAISSQEDHSAVTSFVRRGGYRVPVLIDEKGAVGERYKAHILPATYFIDAEGIVRDAAVGVLSAETLVDKSAAILR